MVDKSRVDILLRPQHLTGSCPALAWLDPAPADLPSVPVPGRPAAPVTSPMPKLPPRGPLFQRKKDQGGSKQKWDVLVKHGIDMNEKQEPSDRCQSVSTLKLGLL